ncbi:MAG TPA: polysaccharide export protein EpsE [Burkholderiales bacterium]|nr:polysaccharide export protein EpsE [Burkholderiales bacterium]
MNPVRLFGVALLLLAALYSATASAQGGAREYRLGAGDNIRITVFQNPDLTLEARVSEEGTISYPLIGAVKVGGMTIAGAEQTIAKALQSGSFIKQPQVSIFPLQIRSNQVSVLGQVNHAGRFPLETFNIRVSEIIAIAGGISATGADVAILTGTRAGKPFRKEIDVPALFLDKNEASDDVVVAGGDVIYIPRAPMYYIYGEVQRPGSYRVESGMTVRQALVQGGGPTVRGTERGLRIYRRGSDRRVETLNPDPNSRVEANDVLYVGESLF